MTILTPQAPHLTARSDVIVMYMFHHVKCHVSVSRTRTSEELRFMITFGTLITIQCCLITCAAGDSLA